MKNIKGKSYQKQEIKRSGSCILKIFIRSIHLQISKLDIQYKNDAYLSFEFVCWVLQPAWYCLFFKNRTWRAGRGGQLRENLLFVMKVIY